MNKHISWGVMAGLVGIVVVLTAIYFIDQSHKEMIYKEQLLKQKGLGTYKTIEDIESEQAAIKSIEKTKKKQYDELEKQRLELKAEYNFLTRADNDPGFYKTKSSDQYVREMLILSKIRAIEDKQWKMYH